MHDRGRDWLDHFERNHAERLPIPWERRIAVNAALREPLIRSLQRFQVGESGDGAHLKSGAARTGSTDYARTIALFIAEEQEHSRWLARLIQGMGGTLLVHHWSDTVFVALRRLCGLRLELMVLLVAEMIAVVYYRALHEGVTDPTLAAVFAQIRRDEDGHVGFHVDFLRGVFAPRPPLTRFIVRTAWHTLFSLACLLVLFDHRGVLRAVGVRPRTFWRRAQNVFRRTAAGIFTPSPAPLAAPAAQSPLG